jgi:hypothetical protein
MWPYHLTDCSKPIYGAVNDILGDRLLPGFYRVTLMQRANGGAIGSVLRPSGQELNFLLGGLQRGKSSARALLISQIIVSSAYAAGSLNYVISDNRQPAGAPDYWRRFPYNNVGNRVIYPGFRFIAGTPPCC